MQLFFFKYKIPAVLIAVAGVVLFSSKAVLVKLAYIYGVSSLHLLMFRMLFALPFYLLLLRYIKPQYPDKIKNSDYLWLVLLGFIGYYLASYFDFLGLVYIKAGLERIILFLYPTLVIIISRIVLKVSVSWTQVVAILLTYIGVVITFWGELSFTGDKVMLGSAFIFISALTYAAYLVGSGWLIPKFGVVVFTSYAMIVSAICVVIHYIVVDRGNLTEYDSEVYMLGFLMAVFATVIPSFLVSLAIKKMGASNFSIVGSIGPVATIIMAYFVLNERLSFIQLCGATIVIFGVFIVSFFGKKS